MARLRREFYPQNPTPGLEAWLVGVLSVPALAFASATLGGLARQMLGSCVGSVDAQTEGLVTALVALAPWVFWPAIVRGTPRAGVSIDPHGLTEWFPLGWRVRHRWARLTQVLVGDTGASLAFGAAEVRLGPPLAGWRRIALAAEEAWRAAHSDSGERAGRQVAPSEVMMWLGGRRELVCQAPRRRWDGLLLAALVVLGGAPYAALRARYDGLALGAALANLALVGWLWHKGLLGLVAAPRARRVTCVRASPEGIDVRSAAGWRRYGWAALTAARPAGRHWVVTSHDGEFWLSPELSDRHHLLPALYKALAARDCGRVLPPAEAEVPATALSRASGEASDERGLSRVSP
jgi:hypothetical protein